MEERSQRQNGICKGDGDFLCTLVNDISLGLYFYLVNKPLQIFFVEISGGRRNTIFPAVGMKIAVFRIE